MPELPEVNTVRLGFHRVALRKKISNVEVFDSKIIRNVDPDVFCTLLAGKCFVDTYRQGKYFFGILENGASVLFHLGMTGDIIYYANEADAPRFERFCISLSDGLNIGFSDQRKFASILYLEDLYGYLKEIKLGPDALKIERRSFTELFENRKTPLKSFLMNQQLVSGIGNLYADEICYQAKLHPASVTGRINKSQRNTIYKCMTNILTLACERDAYYKVYPDDWFWKWRKEGITAPDGISQVKKVKIGGRTTYYAEGFQELIQ